MIKKEKLRWIDIWYLTVWAITLPAWIVNEWAEHKFMGSIDEIKEERT